MSSAAAGAIRDEIQALTAYISRQKLLLDEMQTRLQNLQLRLDSFTYPISTLPPEITCAIFLLCLPEERRTDVVNPKEAPLLLTHICRGWRQIAISLPPLWTRFEVVHPIELPDLSNILKTWFKRSQNSRISVKVHGPFAEDEHGGAPGGLGTLAQTERASFPSFRSSRSFCVRLFENEAALDSEAIQMFSCNVPLLTEVSLGRASPSLVTLPWQQLTKFTGDLYTVRQCLEALHCMPNIVECTFSVPIRRSRRRPAAVLPLQHSALLLVGIQIRPRRSDGQPTPGSSSFFPALQTLEICTDEFKRARVGWIHRAVTVLRYEGSPSTHAILDGGTGLDLRPSFAELASH
ncbi:hypothetical protein C8R46DRAFT_1218508 [Mycena filopes]|nr:hypothetical protein C8R46DRAFT_1218508 [Mycena filopes]